MTGLLRRIGGFARELKRRKVYRVGVAYVVVAAGALQLLDVLVPETRLPEWSTEFFLALAIVGLPLVLVMAWMFDMTPTGVERTAEPEPEATARHGIRPGASAEAQRDPGREGTSAYVSEGRSATVETSTPDPRSIAVLPFENLGGQDDSAPFAAGLHDDLLTELSRIRSLTVISRMSVMGYRGTTRSASEIARELGVGTIVEGGVRQAGGRVRLNVQLIDAVRDAHLWAERYDRELTTSDIFDIQSELAEKIAGTLSAELGSADVGRSPDRPTESLEAYALCARGRSLLDQRTGGEVIEAFGLFRRAIRLDPEYGLAWAGMAMALGLADYYDYPAPDDAPDALHAAERAVELVPESGEVYTSLGIVRSRRQDGPGARRAFGRAVELSPNHAEAHMWLGWIRVVTGRPGRATAPSARGVELSPRSPPAHTFLAVSRLSNGDASGALGNARRGRDLNRDYLLAHFVEAVALYHLGRAGDARSVLETILPEVGAGGNPSRAEVQAVLALTFVGEGRIDATRRLLEEIRAAGETFSIGLVLAGLGEREAAWSAFGRVQTWDSFDVEQIRYLYPDVLGSFRADSRWEELIRDVDRSWGEAGETRSEP